MRILKIGSLIAVARGATLEGVLVLGQGEYAKADNFYGCDTVISAVEPSQEGSGNYILMGGKTKSKYILSKMEGRSDC